MKYVLSILLPFTIVAQAHLGSPADEVMNYHPEVKWYRGETTNGTKYLTADMPLGRFYYYFNDEGYTDFNFQIPYDIISTNKQVAIYNEKYVKNGENAWKAYLKNGFVMNIEMIWDSELNSFVFKYFE